MASMISPSSSVTARLLPFTLLKNDVVSLHRFVCPLRLLNPIFPPTLSLNSPRSSRFLTAAMAREYSAKVIDGESVAKQIIEEISAEVSKMNDAIGVVPGLAVILVGYRNTMYVQNKKKACESVGINFFVEQLPEDSYEQEVLESISNFNDDPSVHGIFVQLPLPSHMNKRNIINAITIEKDVDSPFDIFVPCIPKACIELLHRYGFDFKKKRVVVVISYSNIIGMQVALLLQREDATVTIVHSRAKYPEEITRQADIIITAADEPNMVRGSWIKPGAVIIDVGINLVEDASSPGGYRFVGDVCYEEACRIAGAITPVEWEIDLMADAMLLSNTLSSAKRVHNFK